MRKALAKEVKELQKGRAAETAQLQAELQKVQEHKDAILKVAANLGSELFP